MASSCMLQDGREKTMEYLCAGFQRFDGGIGSFFRTLTMSILPLFELILSTMFDSINRRVI